MSQDDTDWGWRWDKARVEALAALEHITPDDALDILRHVFTHETDEDSLAPGLVGTVVGTAQRRQDDRRRAQNAPRLHQRAGAQRNRG